MVLPSRKPRSRRSMRTCRATPSPRAASISSSRPMEIAKELTRIASHPYVLQGAAPELAGPSKESDDELRKIFVLLRTATGVDFSYYKHTTIKRRIKRRMMLHKCPNDQGIHWPAAGRPAGTGSSLSGYPDPCHGLLPRPGRFQDALTRHLPRHPQESRQREPDSHLGAGVLERRGSLFHCDVPSGGAGRRRELDRNPNLRYRHQ